MYALLRILLASALRVAASQVVKTPLGSLKGISVANDTVAFFDIPYAESQNASRRFRRASPKQPWQGVRDATGPCGHRGQECLQPDAKGGAEDCLFLNVWSPEQKSSKPLPVLVFIHGGGFTQGSGCSANGLQLSQQELVVVSINYRLGVLGFLQHEQLFHEDPSWPSYGGMNGISDQILALNWVQQNIASFGGDPQAVTIWGESAGGESVCDLMSTPLAAGLFQRAIVESGNCVTGGQGDGFGWGPGTLEQGLHAGRDVFKKLKMTSIEELRALDAKDLMQLITNYGPPAAGRSHAGYFVDGYLHKVHPSEAWRAGKLNGESLLIGGNTADGLLEKPYKLAGPLAKKMSDARIDEVLRAMWGNSSAVVKNHYFPASGRYSRSDAAIINAYRDACVLCPSVTMAQNAHKAKLDVFMYGWGAPGSGFIYGLLYGADHSLPHGLELGALFGYASPNLYSSATVRSVVEYWSSFAKTGVPTDSSQRVAWPRFGTPTNPNLAMSPYLYLGEGIPKENGNPESDMKMPTVEDCSFWHGITSIRMPAIVSEHSSEILV